MKQTMIRLWTDDAGQDLVEYSLLLVLLSLVVIASLRLLGPTIAGFFNNIGTNLQGI